MLQFSFQKSDEWIWNNVYVVLRTTAIYFYKDKKTAYEVTNTNLQIDASPVIPVTL